MNFSIRDAAMEAPSKPFLITHERTFTYAEMASCVEERITRLPPSKLVALIGHTSAETIIALLALLETATPFVAIHPRWTELERTRVLEESRPSHLLDGDAIHSLSLGEIEALPTSLLAVLYTSGTSGRSKGAMLSRDAFAHAAHASEARLGWQDEDRWLLAMPLAHVGGLSIVLRCLRARKTVVLAPSGPFDAHAFIHTVNTQQVSIASLVPTQLAHLVSASLAAPSHLRCVLLGGAACPDVVLRRAHALGWKLFTTYGLTEACSQVTTSISPVLNSYDGSGTPLEGVRVEIREGRVWVNSPSLMLGWLAKDLPNPFDEKGFYDTGDLGELDAEGRLHLHARRTDLIVTGGENVYPREVEEAVLAMEGMREACVIGVEDEVWGQRVALLYVGDEQTLEALQQALRLRLAAFKIPRIAKRIEALPLNSVGKIDRNKARSLLA
jgi:O-succinylbenzoic acid--CoA ligase